MRESASTSLHACPCLCGKPISGCSACARAHSRPTPWTVVSFSLKPAFPTPFPREGTPSPVGCILPETLIRISNSVGYKHDQKTDPNGAQPFRWRIPETNQSPISQTKSLIIFQNMIVSCQGKQTEPRSPIRLHSSVRQHSVLPKQCDPITAHSWPSQQNTHTHTHTHTRARAHTLAHARPEV